ncbi:hypothetical protein LCGC14_0146000 [marine sediment metagenome]|uniref:Uncharacterized protein n=1 Tax=marine sediment metagenome TaxID=412755 RepID=A0A0F9V3D5_9ZZZZ
MQTLNRRGTNYGVTIEMILEECCKCAIPFMIPQDFQKRRRKDHDTFYCPSGHPQSYNGITEEQKLKDQIRKIESELVDANTKADRHYSYYIDEKKDKETIERSRNSYKGQVTKVKKRLAAGKCPYCDKEFKDLHSHMQNKHPDYGRVGEN